MTLHTSFRAALFFGSVFLAAFLLGASPATAGFQWVPASSPDVSAPKEQKTIAPTPRTEPKTVETKGLKIDPKGVKIAPSTTNAPAVTAPTQKPALEPQHTLKPPAGAEHQTPSTSGAIQGFADNVPLSVALDQVIPKDVAFVLAPNVSPETVVSWKGGADWRAVLSGLLRSANLSSREEAGKVHIMLNATLGVLPAPTPTSNDVAAIASENDKPVALTAATPPSPPSSPVAAETPAPAAAPVTEDAAKPVSSVSDDTSTVDIAPIPLSMSAYAPVVIPDPVPLSSSGEIIEVWEGGKGETLRTVLRKWASRANVDLSWEAEYDYPLQAAISFTGTFEEAVRLLLVGLQNASPQPYGNLHRNQTVGQTVLVVKARSNKTL